jgi:hypothetical protein
MRPPRRLLDLRYGERVIPRVFVKTLFLNDEPGLAIEREADDLAAPLLRWPTHLAAHKQMLLVPGPLARSHAEADAPRDADPDGSQAGGRGGTPEGESER